MSPDLNTDATLTVSRSRLLDYLTLAKPELTFLSVVTALAGCYLAAQDAFPFLTMVHVLVGTSLVGGGAGALNQYIERKHDALMRRTEDRPIPAGRMVPLEALLFGIVLSVAGLAYLTVATNMLTGFLAVVTITSYLFLYTPLKRITPVATLLGGIPGALPPVMGWTAVRNDLSIEAGVLFAILFCWQMPHFLSLAWMYRKDYGRAGYKVLSVVDETGRRTSRQILLYCVTLIPASLALSLVGLTGYLYAISAVLLGVVFLIVGLQLSFLRTNGAARKLFFVSLLYLPILLLFMVLDKI